MEVRFGRDTERRRGGLFCRGSKWVGAVLLPPAVNPRVTFTAYSKQSSAGQSPRKLIYQRAWDVAALNPALYNSPPAAAAKKTGGGGARGKVREISSCCIVSGESRKK